MATLGTALKEDIFLKVETSVLTKEGQTEQEHMTKNRHIYGRLDR